MIGDLVQQGVTQNDFLAHRHGPRGRDHRHPHRRRLLAGFRFPRPRPALEGEPVIVLEDGKPIERNLRRNRITIEELAAEARLQQYDSLGELRWAVVETRGRISFIPKSRS